MAAGAQVTGLLKGLYDLDKTLIDDHFLDGAGAVSVQVLNTADPAAVQKIEADEQLGSDELVIDSAQLQAKAGAPIKFLNGAVPVTFNGSGSFYAQLGVYPDPTSAKFKAAIGPIVDTKFTIPVDNSDAKKPKTTVVMLDWGANADVAGKGSIAFAAGMGTLDFGAQAHGELFFGVAQQADQTTPIDTALANVVKNWKLPVHVRTADDLDEFTHIMAEAGGSLKTSISATFGHQFNWVRQINDPNLGTILQGDVGLKLQLGINAAFNFSLQGKYAVVVSRETADKVIRVRIYKLKAHEFDFAFSASAAGTLTDPLPANFSDFLTQLDELAAATLGVHPLQILKDLQDPNWLAQFGSQYAQDFLQELFPTLDVKAAQQKLQSFVNEWNNLPSTAASLFAKLARKDVPDFSLIKQVADLVGGNTANLNTELQNIIDGLKVPFLSTSAAQFLEGIADQGALSLLNGVPPDVQKAAKTTSDFLSGQGVADLLNKFETEIENRLGIQNFLGDIQDPASLDKILLAKLTTFLGKQPAIQEIQNIKATLQNLVNKAGTFYNKTIEALKNTYTAQLNATYQQTTTNTALIDASFSFETDANSAGAQPALAQLLAGQLDDFLMNPVAGVTLASGALTHNVVRHSHVDLTLPFFSADQDVINTVNTQFNAVDQQNGRLITYQFKAKDEQTIKKSWWSGRNWRSTSLSLTGQVSGLLPPGSGIRVHATTPIDLKRIASGMSSLRMEVTNMSLPQLTKVVAPFAAQFLPNVFPDSTTSFTNWASAGHLLATPGNTLVSLDVSVPPEAIQAWTKITQASVTDANTHETNEPYRTISLTLQFLLKKYLSEFYFLDIEKYNAPAVASIVLMYAALPNSTALHIQGQPFVPGPYWDVASPTEVAAMIGLACAPPPKPQTGPSLFQAQLQKAHDRLIAAGRNDLAQFYDQSQSAARQGNATSDQGLHLLMTTLLNTESKVVTLACSAAQNIAKFNNLINSNGQKTKSQVQNALKALADFGHNLTDAFNSALGDLFVDDTDALQRLSPLIFAQVTRAFDSSVPFGQNNSLLNVTVLNKGAQMPSDFPDFKVVQGDVLVSLNAASFPPAVTAAQAAGAGGRGE